MPENRSPNSNSRSSRGNKSRNKNNDAKKSKGLLSGGQGSDSSDKPTKSERETKQHTTHQAKQAQGSVQIAAKHANEFVDSHNNNRQAQKEAIISRIEEKKATQRNELAQRTIQNRAILNAREGDVTTLAAAQIISSNQAKTRANAQQKSLANHPAQTAPIHDQEKKYNSAKTKTPYTHVNEFVAKRDQAIRAAKQMDIFRNAVHIPARGVKTPYSNSSLGSMDNADRAAMQSKYDRDRTTGSHDQARNINHIEKPKYNPVNYFGYDPEKVAAKKEAIAKRTQYAHDRSDNVKIANARDEKPNNQLAYSRRDVDLDAIGYTRKELAEINRYGKIISNPQAEKKVWSMEGSKWL